MPYGDSRNPREGRETPSPRTASAGDRPLRARPAALANARGAAPRPTPRPTSQQHNPARRGASPKPHSRGPHPGRPSSAAGEPVERPTFRPAAPAAESRGRGPVPHREAAPRRGETARRDEYRDVARRGGTGRGSRGTAAPTQQRPGRSTRPGYPAGRGRDQAMYLRRTEPGSFRRRPDARQRRGGRAPIALAIVAAIALAGGGAFALRAIRSSSAPSAPNPGLVSLALGTQASETCGDALAVINTPRTPATPQSEWKKGTIPYIYQTDPAWASTPYAGEDIKTSGCGPTCLSMIYVGLTGDTTMDPIAMASFSEKNDFVQEGMTAWTFFSEGAAELGLSSEELPSWADSVVAALNDGKPLVINVQPGDFTTVGHYIVASGLTSDGKLVIHDPNSTENSAKAWDVQRVIDQCSNIWAFEVDDTATR